MRNLILFDCHLLVIISYLLYSLFLGLTHQGYLSMFLNICSAMIGFVRSWFFRAYNSTSFILLPFLDQAIDFAAVATFLLEALPPIQASNRESKESMLG